MQVGLPPGRQDRAGLGDLDEEKLWVVSGLKWFLEPCSDLIKSPLSSPFNMLKYFQNGLKC